VNASYQDFLGQLEIMNITVDDLLKQDSVSRYELTRLLNAVECTDCVSEPQWMFDDYNNDFWSEFITLPWKDFSDINYLGGLFDNTSYYYCVAYVGDQEYMRWYPAEVSPVCAGQFCGPRNVTKAEFIQVLVNLLAQYIHNDYLAPWDKIKIWMENLDKNSGAFGYLDDRDRSIINKQSELCLNDTCQITNVPAFKTYLKYCMYNIDECEMLEFGNVIEWYRPVAELNILYQQKIIDAQEAREWDINLPVNGQKVVEILYKIHDVIGCDFNNDYDCDGLANADDSCPNKYNSNQIDTDGDGIWDVCDEDVDNDGILNPIGIVDDMGNINIGVADPNMDNCLFTINPGQEIDSAKFIGNACSDLENKVAIFIQVDQIDGSVPIKTQFTAITKWTVKNIKRDFWDGNYWNWKTVNHTYNKAWTYTVSVNAIGPNNIWTAKTTVIAGQTNKENIWLIIRSNKIWWSKWTEFKFSSLNIGDIDQIVREINDGTIVTKKPKQSFSKVFSKPGNYQIKAKALKNNQIVAIGITNIAVGIGTKWTRLTSNKIMPNIDQEIDFKTDFYGFNTNEIQNIAWDFGDGKNTINTEYNTKHSFKTEWKKAVVQVIKLKDGTQFINILTIYVINNDLTKSYSLTLRPDKLWIRRWQELSFELQTEWDKLENVILSSYQYKPWTTTRIFWPQNFPISSEPFKYNLSEIYKPKWTITLDACRILDSQATIVVHGMDACLEALLMGDLGKFHCDMDSDGIPDMCDNDIDWDGVENLIGLITHENDDCSIETNVDWFLLNKHIDWVCTLDNCPFSINSEQFDLNRDKIWDSCEQKISGLITHKDQIWDPIKNERKNTNWDTIDTDNDGIFDNFDLCPKLPETYNGIEDIDGCPEIWIESSCENNNANILCGNWVINPGEHCSTCPEDVGTCISICGNWIAEYGENCNNCPEDIPVCGVCGNWIQEPDESCANCPEDYGECTWLCGDWLYDYPETCQTCPDDVDLCEEIGNTCEDIICPGPCNSCPCQYTDFISDLTVGDLVKAILWDRDKLWIYNFSNSEKVPPYLQ